MIPCQNECSMTSFYFFFVFSEMCFKVKVVIICMNIEIDFKSQVGVVL